MAIWERAARRSDMLGKIGWGRLGRLSNVTLRKLLDDGKVHVLDGAMGTMLYAKGFFLNVCYDELNLKQPKLVQEVHEAYVRAGAEILETNTFGANPVKLGSYGLADDTEKINQTAAELARRAAPGGGGGGGGGKRLGGPRRRARRGGETGEGDRSPDFGGPQRRPPQGRRRPEDLPGVPRVHGELRTPHDRGGRAPRGRLLRDYARAHQEDPRLRRERRAAPPACGGLARDDHGARRRGGGAPVRA